MHFSVKENTAFISSSVMVEYMICVMSKIALSISSQKNLRLSRRIFHTSAKTIRGRLLSYLSFQATQLGRQEFDIPFNRQQLADYLSVDRSALSAELGKMQREGLLRFHRSHFLLLSPQKFDT